MNTADVIIAGGGIIGLSAALELAQKGFRVRVLEKGRAMSEASWAAAGMLAAEDPELAPELAELARLSSSLYPEYLRTIERLSGQLVPMRTRGTLQTSEQDVGFAHSDTPTCFAVSAQDAARRIPGLKQRHHSYLWLEEASVDPRDLCAALPVAAVAAGVVLQENAEVVSVNSQAGGVEVETQSGSLSAGAFVNCCGAWAAKIQHPHLERPPAAGVEPWKGQMMMVQLQPPLNLEHVLRTPEVYLVPRGGGRIVIGATMERVGFDRQVEATALAWLRVLAAELWPPIGSAPVVESWSGLRPGTRDGLPLIGEAGPHCWVATGHFRNGILLAPATGLIVRELLEGRPSQASLAAFRPGRCLQG